MISGRLRPGVPLGGAAGRDLRRPAARVRQQRPDPLPRPAPGPQRLPRRAVADRPRPARAVRHRDGRGAGRAAARARRAAGLRLPRPGRRSTSRPPRTSPPAGSGSAAGRRPRSPASADPDHPGPRRAPAPRRPGGQRHPPPAAGPRPRGRPRHRGRRAHQRPRASAGATSSSWCRRASRRRLEVRDLGSTNGMLVDGHRSHPHRASSDGTTVKIGNTTMTVHVVEEDAGCLSSPCS